MTSSIAILLDLDGTLIDSSTDLTVAANVMLESVSRPGVTLEQVESWIGNGVEFLVQRCLTGSMDGRATEELFKRASGIFRTAYLDTGFRQTRCLEGAVELLMALSKDGHALAIVTNKNSEPTHAVLEKLGITENFDAIVCGDTLPLKKPDPAPIQHALQLCGTPSGWMIGDSQVDAAASAAAGIGFIAIIGGYGNEKSPETFPGPPALIVESLLELLDSERRPIDLFGRPFSTFSA